MNRPGDLQDELTAETRRRGEESERGIGKSGHWEIGRRANSCHEVSFNHVACICHPERVGANATPSRRTPTKTGPELAVSGSSHKTLKDALVAACQTIRAMFREIFDESAYDRFLLRTHESRSVASYRAFTRERDAAMVKKPRCC